MQLGCAFSHGLRRDLQTVVDVVCISVRLSRGAKEAAKLAVGITNVGRVEVPVDVEIRGATVTPASDRIGEFAERRQVGCFIKRNAIVERETFSRKRALRNFVES